MDWLMIISAVCATAFGLWRWGLWYWEHRPLCPRCAKQDAASQRDMYNSIGDTLRAFTENLEANTQSVHNEITYRQQERAAKASRQARDA